MQCHRSPGQFPEFTIKAKWGENSLKSSGRRGTSFEQSCPGLPAARIPAQLQPPFCGVFRFIFGDIYPDTQIEILG